MKTGEATQKETPPAAQVAPQIAHAGNQQAKAAKQKPAVNGKSGVGAGAARNAKPRAGVFKPESLKLESPNATAETPSPNDWFKKKFPKLATQYGEPLDIYTPKGQRPRVTAKNESFFAATLGEENSPKNPTVFPRGENRFYTYRPESGIYETVTEEELAARISAFFLDCARACGEAAEVSKLEFGFRDSAALSGVIKRAKALLCVPENFFRRDMSEFLPVGNGVLRVADRTLLPFAPSYRFQNKIPVPYVPAAQCPMFENALLAPSLEIEDGKLLQLWSGLALCGRNISQRIMLLTGTAGAGKGTFIRTLKGVIGEFNILGLRTDKLNDRFEIGRMIGRTLLYGADVPANFLSHENAAALKMLTGGDPLPVEIKNSMDAPPLPGEFNVIATSNSRLTVHLEGDVDAWTRRLLIIRYEKPKPAVVIPDLEKKILEQEASGVLNWMLDGLFALRQANWQFKLTARQQARIDALLLESDSVNVFFRERCCLANPHPDGVTATDAFAAYSEFCFERGWNPLDRRKFGVDAPDAVQRFFRLATRHDIKGADGKKQRGWKGLRLLAPDETSPE